jgi:hypothetical protein
MSSRRQRSEVRAAAAAPRKNNSETTGGSRGRTSANSAKAISEKESEKDVKKDKIQQEKTDKTEKDADKSKSKSEKERNEAVEKTPNRTKPLSTRNASLKRKRENETHEQNGTEGIDEGSNPPPQQRQTKKTKSKRGAGKDELKGKSRLPSRSEKKRSTSPDANEGDKVVDPFPLPPEGIDYREIAKQKLEELHERKKKLDDFRKRTEWLLEMITSEQAEISKRIDELKTAKLSQYNPSTASKKPNGEEVKGDGNDSNELDALLSSEKSENSENEVETEER